jgi:hypothetical protein
MRRSPAVTVGLLIAIAAATAWCFAVVIGRRFEGGDVYPPCSSQRVDPMGAKVLYDALDRLAGTSCERNFKRFAKLSDVNVSEDSPIAASRQGHTLLLLDVDSWVFSDGNNLDGGVVRDFAVAGGRVVITVDGNMDSADRVRQASEERQKELEEARRKAKKDEAAKKKEEDKTKNAGAKSGPEKEPSHDSVKRDRDRLRKKADDKDDDEMLPFRPAKSLVEAIQIDVVRDSLKLIPENGHELATPSGISGPHGKLPRWLSRVSLDLAPKAVGKKKGDDQESERADVAKTDLEEQVKASDAPAKDRWQIIATVEDKPVIAERRFGRGSIVVATDSYFATNQALLMNPTPEFLAWLIGDAQHVIFDETHLGTQENPGIMTLARRYRLHGFFLGGVLLFGLFVWQSSSSLVPARDGLEPGVRAVAGQGAVAGLVSLLRRGVSRSRLLQTCFDQWVRNHPHPSPALRARIDQARAVLPSETKRPSRGMLAQLYQRLCETLHPNRH